MGQHKVVAVACDGLKVATSLPQTSSYMCYTVDGGRVTDCHNIPAMDQPLEKLPDFFHALGAQILIVGKIDADVVSHLIENDIDVASDKAGDPLTNVRSFLHRNQSAPTSCASISPANPNA